MAISFVADAVATGTSSTITWTIPAHQAGDLILCVAAINNTDTDSFADTPDSTWFTNPSKRTPTNAPHPALRFWKNATGSGTTLSVTMDNGAGTPLSVQYRALAVVYRGAYLEETLSTTAAASSSSSATSAAPFTTVVGDWLVGMGASRLATSGTATVTTTPALTHTESEDSYLSNLHTGNAYATVNTATDYNHTINYTTSAANTTALRLIRWHLREAPNGAVSSSMPSMDASVAGDVATSVSGTASPVLPEMSATFTVDVIVTGTADATLPEFTATNSGSVVVTSSLDSSMDEMTATFTGGEPAPEGPFSATLPELSAEFTGTEIPQGSVTATMPEMGSTMTGSATVTGSVTAELPALDSSSVGGSINQAALDAAMEPPTASAGGAVVVSGTSALTLPAMSAEMTSSSLNAATFAATLPAMLGALDGEITVTGLRVHVVEEEFRTMYVVAKEPQASVVTQVRHMVAPETRRLTVPAESRTTYVVERVSV